MCALLWRLAGCKFAPVRSKENAELPLIISDHCDWPELLQTIEEVNPKEVWVTHGREDALMYQAEKWGSKLGHYRLSATMKKSKEATNESI